MARPRFQPMAEQRRTVEAMAAYGVPEDEIAKTIGDDGIDPKTLRKYFRRELDVGATKANSAVAQRLYKMAWHAGVHAGEVMSGLSAAGFEVRSQIIWAKQHFALSRGHYHWQHEPCWYAVRRGRASHWRGDRTQSTLWEVANLNCFGGDREEPVTGHGTQKPVELMRRPLLNHTERGEAVYDPFLGSGTTLVAAALLERVCYGIEIDPRYVDVTIRRWQQLLGQDVRLEDGRSWLAVERERVQAA